MQPATTVVTGIYNYRFFIAATPQQFGIDFAEAFAVHSSDMYIADLTSRQIIYLLTAVLYPAFVQ